RRRREVPVLCGRRPWCADHIADPDAGQAPEPADLPPGERRTPDGRATVEDADRGDLPLVFLAEPQPVPGPYRPREHPGVRDLLPGGTTFDLEDRARDGAV